MLKADEAKHTDLIKWTGRPELHLLMESRSGRNELTFVNEGGTRVSLNIVTSTG